MELWDQKFLTVSRAAQRMRNLISLTIKSTIFSEIRQEFRKVARFRACQIQYRQVAIKKCKREEDEGWVSERGYKIETTDIEKGQLLNLDRIEEKCFQTLTALRHFKNTVLNSFRSIANGTHKRA